MFGRKIIQYVMGAMTVAVLMGATVPVVKHYVPGHDAMEFSPFANMPRLNVSSFDLHPMVDLRRWCPPIYDQGRSSSCTAFAIAKGLLETERRLDYRPAPEMSAQYFYYRERELTETTMEDTGARLEVAMKVLMSSGCATEKAVPYDPAYFFVPPPDSSDKEAGDYRVGDVTPIDSNLGVMEALDARHPVAVGMLVWSSLGSFETVTTGVVRMPGKNDVLRGGHALCLVGYDPEKKYFIARNSWGTRFGDNGYLYIPYAYMQKFCMEAFSIKLFR